MCAKFTENPSSLPADPAAFHLAVLGLSGTADLVLEINEQGQRKKKRSGLTTTHVKRQAAFRAWPPCLAFGLLSEGHDHSPLFHSRTPVYHVAQFSRAMFNNRLTPVLDTDL